MMRSSLTFSTNTIHMNKQFQRIEQWRRGRSLWDLILPPSGNLYECKSPWFLFVGVGRLVQMVVHDVGKHKLRNNCIK